MTASQDKLVLSHKYLVIKIADRYKNRGVDWEDLLQEGYTALCVAATKFDATRGNRFSTYATSYVMGYLQSMVDHNTVIKPIRVGTKFVNAYVDFIEDNNQVKSLEASPVTDAIENSCDWENLQYTLSAAQFDIISMRYAGYRDTEIARKYNLTKRQFEAEIQKIQELVLKYKENLR